MANTITQALGVIFAQGLLALRENCVMPRLVNSDYSTDAQAQGDAVNIVVAPTRSAVAITPAATAPDAAAQVPTKKQIVLDQHYEAPFDLTDVEINNLYSFPGYRSSIVSEAVRSLANNVNSAIFGVYTGVYGYVGTAGTTPFATDVSDATQARKTLANQLAPMAPRSFVLDPDAEANALGLRAFQDASFRGDSAGIMEGQIGRKLGFQFASDQQVPTHTTSAAGTVLVDDAAAVAVGVTSIHMDGFTTKPEAGDVFTIAGDSQTYTVVSSTTLVGTDSDVTFQPPLKVALPTGDNNEAVTFKASHVVNLAFHREAIGFASRTLAGDAAMTDAERQNVVQVADPESGLTLRLERRREHYRTRWSFSTLYGVTLIRPEYAVRVAG